MRTAIWTIVWFALSGIAWGQGRVHLYEDDRMMWRDMVAHVDQGLVRMGCDWRGEVAFTLLDDGMWDETKVFQGFSTSTLDLALTVREDRVYLGDSQFTDAILYTVRDGQVFQGDSTFPLDVLYTIREEAALVGSKPGVPTFGVYKEDSMAWTDRVAVLEGIPSTTELVALLLASGWL